ncbi:hypothetical protein JOB18_008513 [Solea senegalensis]|nr:hypothetical protein JOB18_008513 [Solea senegalensis]
MRGRRPGFIWNKRLYPHPTKSAPLFDIFISRTPTLERRRSQELTHLNKQ